jgi:hypothetical protein
MTSDFTAPAVVKAAVGNINQPTGPQAVHKRAVCATVIQLPSDPASYVTCGQCQPSVGAAVCITSESAHVVQKVLKQGLNRPSSSSQFLAGVQRI